MLNKVRKFLLGFCLAGGIVSILSAFLQTDLATTERVVYFIGGILLCLISLWKTLRHVLVSALFALTSLSVIYMVITSELALDSVSILTFLFCLAISLFFGFRASKAIRLSSVRNADLATIDRMSGLEFEQYTAQLLRKLGYTNVSVTKASGDQGVDVLATKGGKQYAIQCKNYKSQLDNTPVQEVYAGMRFYRCDHSAVITNSTFTQGAKQLARATGVELWDRATLAKMIHSANKAMKNIEDPASPTELKKAASVLTTPAQNATVTPPSFISHNRSEEGICNDDRDPMLAAAVDAILASGTATASVIQRHLKVGYARASYILDEMESLGIVGPFEEGASRQILVTQDGWEHLRKTLSRTVRN